MREGVLALNKNNAALRVYTAGQQQGVAFQRVFSQGPGVLSHGDGMKVGIIKNSGSFPVFLPSFNCAEVVADGDDPDAECRKDTFFLIAVLLVHRE
jgi:hypothetical protein